ncbi:TRPA1-like protein, partial [Mya arenaria]
LTPLMVASKNGHADVVEYLIKKDADVTKLDKKDHNCLDIAILNNHECVAKTIIKSNRWDKALKNYTKTDDGMECTPFRKLIRHMPHTAKAVLDKCMNLSTERTKGEQTDEEKRCIEFNFDFIDDPYYINEWSNKTDQKAPESDCDKMKKTHESYKKNFDQHPMMIMAEAGQLNLLLHPVVKCLRQHKWDSLARRSYF